MNKLLIGTIVGLVVGGGVAGTTVYYSRDTSTTLKPATSTSQTAGQPAQNQTQTQSRITASNCIADQCLQVPSVSYPVSGLSDSAKQAMNQAIDNEYKLHAYYQAAISKFGDQRPFAMIVGAESQHIAVLGALYDKYGLSLPTDSWAAQTYDFTTFPAACSTALGYEKGIQTLYDGLVPQVTSYADITQVMTNIKDATPSHISAFQKCAQ